MNEETLSLLTMDDEDSRERGDFPDLHLLRTLSVDRKPSSVFETVRGVLKPPMEARLALLRWRGGQHPPLVYFVFLASYCLAMDQNLMAPNLSVSLLRCFYFIEQILVTPPNIPRLLLQNSG